MRWSCHIFSPRSEFVAGLHSPRMDRALRAFWNGGGNRGRGCGREGVVEGNRGIADGFAKGGDQFGNRPDPTRGAGFEKVMREEIFLMALGAK